MSRTGPMLLGLALPAAFLAGCASAPAAGRSSARADCIRTGEINAMTPLDDRHVLVKLGANRHYLLTTDSACHGLSLARQLGVWERSPRMCADGVSMLAFEHPTVGDMRCRIAKLEPVADKWAALDLIAAQGP